MFSGDLVDGDDGRSSFDFPSGLLDRTEWAHLLLRGLKTLSDGDGA
ncbi:hypothetical protein ACGFIV_15095 [Sphaerisporangium sp. NPDC049003]